MSRLGRVTRCGSERMVERRVELWSPIGAADGSGFDLHPAPESNTVALRASGHWPAASPRDAGVRRQSTVVRVHGLRVCNRRHHRHRAPAQARHLRAREASVPPAVGRRVHLQPAERPLVLPPHLMRREVRAGLPDTGRLSHFDRGRSQLGAGAGPAPSGRVDVSGQASGDG